MLSTAPAQAITAETRDNFAEHSAGFLNYRRSVTEAGDWTAIEWTGRGAIFWDALGREHIDCVGSALWFGIEERGNAGGF